MSREDSNTVLRDVIALSAISSGSTSARQARGERKGVCESSVGGTLHDLERTIDLCAEIHKRKRSQPSDKPDLTDAGLSKLARFSDALDLHRYGRFVHLIPRIVNVVRDARSCAPNPLVPSHTRALRRSPSARRSPSPAPTPCCRSTCARSPAASPTPTTRPGASRYARPAT